MSGTNENNDVLYLHITPSGKKYFGVTSQEPEKRWRDGKGYAKNEYFTNAIEKYGWDNIQHIILADGLTPEEADLLEVFFIALYDTTDRNKGYNLDHGGRRHYRHSEETKRKQSKAREGKYVGENSPIFGRTYSKDHRQKMSDAKKGRTGKKCPNSKIVVCITTKQIFYGLTEAERTIGVSHSSISAACRGKLKSAGTAKDGSKLKWKYLSYNHNKIYHIVGGYYVDKEQMMKLIEDAFPTDEEFDLESWNLFDDVPEDTNYEFDDII